MGIKSWVMQNVDRGTVSEAYRISKVFEGKKGQNQALDLAIDLGRMYPSLDFYQTTGDLFDTEYTHCEKEYFIEAKALSKFY